MKDRETSGLTTTTAVSTDQKNDYNSQMKTFRVLIVGVIATVAALAGTVMLGDTTAGTKATYYACADATTGALRRVQPEETCLEGEERLVWSDGQQEPTPAPPSTICRMNASGSWQEFQEQGAHNMFSVPGVECSPKWMGLTIFEIEYTLTTTNFTRGYIGQGYGISSTRAGCNASTGFNDCAGLGANAPTPRFTPDNCNTQDPCVITFIGSGQWVRGIDDQKLFVLFENEFNGTWSLVGKISLKKSP